MSEHEAVSVVCPECDGAIDPETICETCNGAGRYTVIVRKRLTLDEYAELASRTYAGTGDIRNAALGLCGEAGEFAEAVKKSFYHGHPLDGDKAVAELGDVLWYLTYAAHCLGVSLETVARRNNEKLMRRYPNGFTSDDSINREDTE